MLMKPYTPKTPQRFWCTECDHNTVDSTQPETGTFHLQFGHTFDPEKREYDGDYLGVMFAICKPCMTAFKKSLTEQA